MNIPPQLLEEGMPSFKQIVLDFLTNNNVPNAEIEARLGQVMSKITQQRLNYDISHPVIFETIPFDLNFVSGVKYEHLVSFKKRVFGMDYEKSNFRRERRDQTTISDRFRKIETFYSSEKDDGVSVTYQNKSKIKEILIYMPHCKYDVKISISVEKKVDESEFKPENIKLQRERHRESFLCKDYVFDVTRIKNKILKPKEMEIEQTFEIELEVLNINYNKEEYLTMVFNLSNSIFK